MIGERAVSGYLSDLPSDQYVVMNDVILPTPNGSTQIDHIVVSVYGIFVIETKNMKGSIYGKENSEFWRQYIHGNEFHMYNPMRQNAGHIKALYRVLNNDFTLPIYSIVAFSERANLKIGRTESPVIYWYQLISTIQRYNSKHLSWGNVLSVCKLVNKSKLDNDKQTKAKHLRDIETAKIHKDFEISSGRCPRCGGTLVLRNGKYGEFYGCSNYPKCKYTRVV